MKKIIYSILSLVLVCVFMFMAIASSETGTKDDESILGSSDNAAKEPFTVHMIDVGQGDCILVKSDDKVMLIDAGERGNGEKIIDYLTQQDVKKIDYLVATHPHSDHIGSMPEVLEHFKVKNVIMPKLQKSMTPTTQIYKKLVKAIKASGARVIAAKAGAEYELGQAHLTVVGPCGTPNSLNNASVVIKADYGDSSFLFTGDAEKEAEQSILQSGADIDVDVLKMGHHGSSTSSSKAFFDKVSPELCLISCGEDNKYGHPHRETLALLKKTGVPYKRTDLNGTVIVGTDGSKISISHER